MLRVCTILVQETTARANYQRSNEALVPAVRTDTRFIDPGDNGIVDCIYGNFERAHSPRGGGIT